MSSKFLIAVITSPDPWGGEADVLEELLEAGVEKLHIRRRGESRDVLLQRLAPDWSSRLVVHGGQEIMGTAVKYRIPQVHGHWARPWEVQLDSGSGRVNLSASVHSWDEVRQVSPGSLEYVFLSPLFDSISKPGYMAGAGLLQRPPGVRPCKMIGLGGIGPQTIGQVIDHGWDGAAVLGYIWENPAKAVERFNVLKEIVDHHGR